MKKIWYIKPHNFELNDVSLQIITKMVGNDDIFIQTTQIPSNTTNWMLLNDVNGSFLGELAFGGWLIKK